MSSLATNSSDAVKEPRGYTLQDLMVAVAGVALMLTLPAGISWFDPATAGMMSKSHVFVAYSVWICGIGFVALSFTVVARHWKFHREARPAEWVILSCGGLYLLEVFLSLHDRFGSSLLAVSNLEQRLAPSFGSAARKAILLGSFAILAGYLVQLIRSLKLAPHLRTVLSLLLLVGLLWGPCGLWQSYFASPPGDPLALRTAGNEWSEIGLPQLPVAVVLLCIFHWALGMRALSPNASWNAIEIAGLVLFVVALIFLAQYSLILYGLTAGGIARLAMILFIWNLPAGMLGWGLALLQRRGSA